MFSFVKQKLKSLTTWILIYDNVENFSDIKEYIPHDSNLWGDGKLVITTRDKNIQNNNLINSKKTIFTQELSEREKHTLFSAIMHQQSCLNSTDLHCAEIKNLFHEIPSFPLDIITAAYYIKDTKIGYKEYIKRIKELKIDFEKEQENLLKELNYYTKTRYGIITLTLDKIIAEDQRFKALLFFISVLDSQNIPRALLGLYEQNSVVEKFMRSLRKYSFLTHESYLRTNNHEPTFSLHRNTQQIIQNYLSTILSPALAQKLVQKQADAMKTYTFTAIKDDDIPSLKVLMSHIRFFLQNSKIISNSLKGNLMGQLGYIYLNFGDYKRAEHLFRESLKIYKILGSNYSSQTAWILKNIGILQTAICKFKDAKGSFEESLLLYEGTQKKDYTSKASVLKCLGEVFRSLGDFDSAEKFTNQALVVFNKDTEKNSAEIAATLKTLGIINRNKGEFLRAKDFLEKSLAIYKKIFGENHIKTSEVLSLWGRNYRSLGNYEKAQSILEKQLEKYEAYYGKNHTKTAEMLMILGITYLSLGKILKAKELCEQSVQVYKNTYGIEHIMVAEASGYLGAIHRELGDYTQAKELLKFAYKFYLKRYGSDHIRVAPIVHDLAHVYLLEKNLELAEKLTMKSYKIFQNNNNCEIYLALELLANLYFEKSKKALQENNVIKARQLKKQAIFSLKEAIRVVQIHLDKNSMPSTRLEKRMKQFENNQ